MEIGIIAALVVLLIVIGVTSVRRRLAEMDENVGGAMNQIGVQLDSCFDALDELLRAVGSCDAREAQRLGGLVRASRRPITAQSSAAEAAAQERVIEETLLCVRTIEEQHPELKTDKNYRKWIDAVVCYGKMLRTSRLIYNDSADKLNQAIWQMPAVLVAGLLGFRRREHLEEQTTFDTV